MPAEHLRENGGLSQGYFCGKCGQVVAMYGHMGSRCKSNPELVNKLIEINKAGSLEQYVFNKLKKPNNG